MTVEARGESPVLPVVLDAMGGDRAPAVTVEAAIAACDAGLGPLILTGDADRIQAEFEHHSGVSLENLPIEILHASEVIGMAEHPSRAARTKKDSSMHVGLNLVRDGVASAFVSAGNSGAVMATAILTLGRIARCDRPALASVMPTGGKTPTIAVDIGANVECRASHLVQFALLGAAYAELVLERTRPTVGLLANGTEPTKGTETLREAHRLLTQTDLRYVGFVEGSALPLGEVDVIVTDGFVGNVALKVSEGVALGLIQRLQAELEGDVLGSLGARLMKRAFQRLDRDLDWRKTGGAPLLGVNGIVTVAHGASNPAALVEAIRLARKLYAADLNTRLEIALEEANAPLELQTSTSELPITRSGGFENP